jgi:hypothetical protein
LKLNLYLILLLNFFELNDGPDVLVVSQTFGSQAEHRPDSGPRELLVWHKLQCTIIRKDPHVVGYWCNTRVTIRRDAGLFLHRPACGWLVKIRRISFRRVSDIALALGGPEEDSSLGVVVQHGAFGEKSGMIRTLDVHRRDSVGQDLDAVINAGLEVRRVNVVQPEVFVLCKDKAKTICDK